MSLSELCSDPMSLSAAIKFEKPLKKTTVITSPEQKLMATFLRQITEIRKQTSKCIPIVKKTNSSN